MMDETVQITNELLCFVQNKSDILPYDVVKLTSDIYYNEQIEKLKKSYLIS